MNWEKRPDNMITNQVFCHLNHYVLKECATFDAINQDKLHRGGKWFGGEIIFTWISDHVLIISQ